MSFNFLLKALRDSANLSRQRTVAQLRRQGVRTSVATLRRLENGDNRSLDLVLALLNLYHSRAPIRPGIIETAFMGHNRRLTFNDRRRRFIAANLPRCDAKELEAIEQIIRNIDS